MRILKVMKLITADGTPATRWNVNTRRARLTGASGRRSAIPAKTQKNIAVAWYVRIAQRSRAEPAARRPTRALGRASMALVVRFEARPARIAAHGAMNETVW